MGDRELYLAFGVPALIGIANLGAVITLVLWFASRVESRIDRFEAKVDNRFDQTNGRIDRLEAKLDQTNGRIDRLEVKIDQTNGRIDRLGEEYTRFYGEQRAQDARIAAVEKK